MHWIAPSERDVATDTLEKRRWAAAEQAGPAPSTGLNLPERFGGSPQGSVLGLIFLRFAELRFASKLTRLESPPPLEAGRASANRDGVRGVGQSGDSSKDHSTHGVEKTDETGRRFLLNLAVYSFSDDFSRNQPHGHQEI